MPKGDLKWWDFRLRKSPIEKRKCSAQLKEPCKPNKFLHHVSEESMKHCLDLDVGSRCARIHEKMKETSKTQTRREKRKLTVDASLSITRMLLALKRIKLSKWTPGTGHDSNLIEGSFLKKVLRALDLAKLRFFLIFKDSANQKIDRFLKRLRCFLIHIDFLQLRVFLPESSLPHK